MRREETVDHNIKAAWHSIARMYNQQALKYDATMSMGFVLLNINSDEGTPATKIAPLMGLEARSLTRLLKSMEEKKLIYREADKIDKRSVRVRLTKERKNKKGWMRSTKNRPDSFWKATLVQIDYVRNYHLIANTFKFKYTQHHFHVSS